MYDFVQKMFNTSLKLEDGFEFVRSLILNCRKMNANEANEAIGFGFDNISNTVIC